MHFHGTPFRYASVEVLRNEKRDICSQPHDDVPDLLVQSKKLKSEGKSSSATTAPEKQTMPWDVRLPVPELNEEILAKLPNLISGVGMIFNDPHIQMARPLLHHRQQDLVSRRRRHKMQGPRVLEFGKHKWRSL